MKYPGLPGGLAGGLMSYLVLNGYTVSTVGSTFTQVNFDFMVSVELQALGISIAGLPGLIVDAVPAMNAVHRLLIVGLKNLIRHPQEPGHARADSASVVPSVLESWIASPIRYQSASASGPCHQARRYPGHHRS